MASLVAGSKLDLLRSHFWFQHSLIVLICIACYGFALRGDFVFDDSVAVVRNQDVTNSSTTLAEILRHDFWGTNLSDPTSHKSFRPLTTLMFQLEVRIFGLRADPMKFHNFALHVLVCWLLLSTLPRLFPNTDTVVLFFATALFAVHPVHSEAVSGVVGRAELLCAVFYLLAILLSLRLDEFKEMSTRRNIVGYCCIVLLAALALLSKETGITVLPTCIALGLIKSFHSVQLRFGDRLLHMLSQLLTVKYLAFICFTVILIFGRLGAMHFEGPQFKEMDNPIAAANDFATRALSQCYLYALNLWILLCPDWLSFDWALGSIQLVQHWTDIRILPTVFVFLTFVMMLLFGRRDTHTALVLIIVPFLPASGIVKLGFVIAERVLYIPSIGFCALVALGLDKLCFSFRRQKEILLYAFGICLFVLAVRCHSRAAEWAKEESLFLSAIRVCPSNAKVHYNIAKLMADKNERATAFGHYHKAIELFSDYEAAHMNLGNLYREEKLLDLAEHHLRRSILILEEFPTAWMNLGIVLATLGKYDEALLSYRNALKYRKKYATCYYNIGNLYIEVNNKTLALKYWQEAVAINPGHTKAWANILAMLDNTGRTEEVLQLSEKAIRHAPHEPSLIFSRANALGKLGRFDEAEQAYLEALARRPNNALYHVNLGVLYHRWSRRLDAAAAYRRALSIDPEHRSARENLAKLGLNV